MFTWSFLPHHKFIYREEEDEEAEGEPSYEEYLLKQRLRSTQENSSTFEEVEDVTLLTIFREIKQWTKETITNFASLLTGRQ